MRLIEYIYYSGNSIQGFADEIGYDRNYIAQIAKGERKASRLVTKAIVKGCRGFVNEVDVAHAYLLAQKIKESL